MQRIFRLSLILCAYATLTACAGGARPELMAVQPESAFAVTASSPYYQAISIQNVSGGKETNPMLVSKVDNDAFQGALKSSLESYNLLNTSGNAKYVLDAELLALEQPVFGMSFTVDSVVKYILKNTATNSVVYNETIKAAGKATMGDSLLGMERLRIANEFSIKENIQSFINALTRR